MFMSLMNRFFWDYLNSFVNMFIDDIFIYYKKEKEHDNHLRLAFQVIKEQQIYDKFSKRKFWLRSIAFLGHIISGIGVEILRRQIWS